MEDKNNHYSAKKCVPMKPKLETSLVAVFCIYFCYADVKITKPFNLKNQVNQN